MLPYKIWILRWFSSHNFEIFFIIELLSKKPFCELFIFLKIFNFALAEGGIVPLHSHPIPLLGNVEQGTIVVKRQGMEDLTYKAGDSFIVGPKTPKHTMGNAQTDNAVVWFAAIGAKDVPILIPAEG